MVNINILDLDEIKPVEAIKNAGGELHFTLTQEQIFAPIMVCAKLRRSEDIMKLLLVTDVLKQNRKVSEMGLYIPYFPYARQDRVANAGEPLSVKVMAELVNNLGYDTVHICDPHSLVTDALVNQSVSCLNVESFLAKNVPDYLTSTVIAPDAGAFKKLSNIIKKVPIVQCTKHRDTTTGKLSNTMIHTEEDLTGKDLIVVDDICDGGYTFILLAEAIKKQYTPKSLTLYVTHGIFSKGLDVLKEHYDHVYTTDSFYQGESDDFLTVVKLMETI